MSVIVNPSLTVILSEAKDLVAKNLARGKLCEAISLIFPPPRLPRHFVPRNDSKRCLNVLNLFGIWCLELRVSTWGKSGQT